jgi:hypothetical protein
MATMGNGRGEEGGEEAALSPHAHPPLALSPAQEILVRERTKCPQWLFLQRLEWENFRTGNFSDGLEFLGRGHTTHQVCLPHWKF